MLLRRAALTLACAVHTVYASVFSITTEMPPYLVRPGPVPARLDWDTGDLARHMALSQAIHVNHQGVRRLAREASFQCAHAHASNLFGVSAVSRTHCT